MRAQPMIFATSKPHESPIKELKAQRETAPVTAASPTAVADRIATVSYTHLTLPTNREV